MFYCIYNSYGFTSCQTKLYVLFTALQSILILQKTVKLYLAIVVCCHI